MGLKSAQLLRNGFRILPVKFDEYGQAVHQLFYKANLVRGGLIDMPSDRTLFVINIPPYCTEECLKRLFERFGPVETVHFEGNDDRAGLRVFKTAKLKAFQVAHLVFLDKADLKVAMTKNIQELLCLSEPGAHLVTGIYKWVREYNNLIPNVLAMKTQIDQFMKSYDKEKDTEIQKEKEEAGVPDADGWIKVTRYGKRSIIPRTIAKEQKIQKSEMKKKCQKELQNFYSFQIRESKMEHIAQLRQKFQADKERIAMMKASRKFKPY